MISEIKKTFTNLTTISMDAGEKTLFERVNEALGDVALNIDTIVHQMRLIKDEEEIDLLRKADRKSTRLNSSHVAISYAVFCLKKKKKMNNKQTKRQLDGVEQTK